MFKIVDYDVTNGLFVEISLIWFDSLIFDVHVWISMETEMTCPVL